MKALVIVGASIRLCPYAVPYINELLYAGFEVTAMVWVRDGQPDAKLDDRVRVLQFVRVLDDSEPLKRKLWAFVAFRRFLMKELRKEYDFVIALDTQFAVLVCDVLLTKYKNRFIYDMRDMSYEHISWYRVCVRRIIDAACAVFISSDGYRKYLPENAKIHTTHNLQSQDLEYSGIRALESRVRKSLRVSFWGVVRDIEINKMIIRALGNDSRFELHYYGALSKSAHSLELFAKEQQYLNVFFHGRYDQKQRYEFARNTDIIHNMYSNPVGKCNPAMGNKYYDGIVFRIPQICTTGGYMGERVSQKNVGIVLPVDNKLADSLYEYYSSIKWDEFEEVCKNEVQVVINENNKAFEILRGVIGERII